MVGYEHVWLHRDQGRYGFNVHMLAEAGLGWWHGGKLQVATSYKYS